MFGTSRVIYIYIIYSLYRTNGSAAQGSLTYDLSFGMPKTKKKLLSDRLIEDTRTLDVQILVFKVAV